MSSSTFKAVVDIVQRVPAGNVTTYGEVAKAAGVSPRYVGWVMGKAELPWWRVVRSTGQSHDIERAREHWEREGISYSGDCALMSKHGLDCDDLVRGCD
ncbi:MGMT family protein [Corynebacterium sp.]|uniref:MGMT family protein n=1 Tax=Corynebacterium sp. TaxID=1720 RepID=UPI0026DD4084|nr:MGMT family protein [Corynebacterium sp.]MDO5032586.1 MGMT family protein [Corynebacterium sp.]